MPTQTFIADSAADALAQIRAKLGPEAVVLNVRQVTGAGVSRLWQKPRIEVVAQIPDAPVVAAPTASAADGMMELRRELAEIRGRLELDRRANALRNTKSEAGPRTEPFPPPGRTTAETRLDPVPIRTFPPTTELGLSHVPERLGQLLERAGLDPRHARRIVEECDSARGANAPATLGEELSMAQAVIARLWRPAPALVADPRRPHVFVGAPGSGKTTALCKWLAQTVLLEGRPAHVWRLDGNTANTAEALSVYGEILGVSVARFWRGADEADAATISFVDLPGVAWRDEAALETLAGALAAIPGAQIHLALNAAYEVSLQLAQVRAFARVGVTDLCLTHLDEETRWGKLWNLALGTNLPLRFLGAGQNIPGEFFPASAEKIFSRQFAGI